MSLNFARELLKISLSQLCDASGFDITSEIAMDILVDVCERQFQCLAKQTSNLIQLNNRYQPTFFDLLSILLENNHNNIDYLQEHMSKFQSLSFSQDIIQFPYKKRNQFYLRIPSEDSMQLLERTHNQSMDYIYDWLPLFPDQETPEQSTSINIDTNLDATVYNDQEKKTEKSDSHRPLTLLSLLSKNGDETIAKPMGKRPNRSLPSILYRPRRIMEMEAVAAAAAAATAAAEKAKKEQLEKENTEKDQQQQQGPPPPLRLTIPKPTVINDKSASSSKKILVVVSTTTTTTTTATTTTEGAINIQTSTTSLLTTDAPTVNPGNKIFLDTLTNDPSEKPSLTNPSATLPEILSSIDQTNDTILDLTKKSTTSIPTAKLPKLKLNLKNVSSSQTMTNSGTPSTATTKFQRPAVNATSPHGQANLKIRTSSLPLFETSPKTNEINPIITPPIVLSNELRTEDFVGISTNNKRNLIDNNQLTDAVDSINSIDQQMTSIRNVAYDEEKKKRKKKKKNDDQESIDIKKHKKEEENTNNEQKNIKIDVDSMSSATNESLTTIASSTNQSTGTALRLKIKLGKPSILTNNVETKKSDDLPISVILNDNEQHPSSQTKQSPIRLTLPVVPPCNLATSSSAALTHPLTVSKINRTTHYRKTRKDKHHASQTDETNRIISTSDFPLHEDNTVSIDDVPLGERASPNKSIGNTVETNSSQPIKRKSNTTRKKSNNSKRANNTVGIAVIEEQRIQQDSQEKIWICPSCNRPDNGQEAMIACDLCDDWYHWECVDIVEEPPESIPWFCPKCHRSNSSTASAQGIKPSASSKAKRQRASTLYQQKQQQQKHSLV